jgi:hypothetical protein
VPANTLPPSLQKGTSPPSESDQEDVSTISSEAEKSPMEKSLDAKTKGHPNVPPVSGFPIAGGGKKSPRPFTETPPVQQLVVRVSLSFFSLSFPSFSLSFEEVLVSSHH